MSLIDRLLGRKPAPRRQRRRFSARSGGNSIVAAQSSAASPGWPGMPNTEDAANTEFQYSRREVIQRAQDLDVNNPDVRGFHRARVAQILGDGVAFKFEPKASEVGLTPAEVSDIAVRVDRLRQLHSEHGGFDASGKERWEGTQQARAFLTAFGHGCCLIHRVWREDADAISPLSIELIPGSRISTPYDRAGDPLLSYGVEYADTNRSRVVAYHVRRVSQTRGDSFVPDYVWDRLPIEDCSLLELSEMAGIDLALPLSVACVKMLRSRGEFVEAAVNAARAQSCIYGVTECAPGSNPYDVAQDDADQAATDTAPAMMTLGDVKMLYNQNGEKTVFPSAQLPDPDFTGFMDVTDERIARGLSSSKSRFTRRVNSSWAGGRLEDQQDEPIIKQYRKIFLAAWAKVNQWWIESLWLSGQIELPGYGADTRFFWSQHRAQFPGSLHINPVDVQNARQVALMTRTLTPQQACEEDGKDFHGNLRQWAEAVKAIDDTEKEHGLKPGTLEVLLSGKAISTSAGAEITPPAPEAEQNGQPIAKIKNGRKVAYAATTSAKMSAAVRFSIVPTEVDPEKRIIRGFAVATKGEAKGHGSFLDDVTLDQIVELGNKGASGVGAIRCRMDHPTSGDGSIENPTANLLGFPTNFRRDGDVVRADLQLLSPQAAPMSDRFLALAREAPHLFGCSMVFDQIKKADKSIGVRIKELFALDFVDMPAANPSGLFGAGTGRTNMDPLEAYVKNGKSYCAIDGKEYELKLPKEIEGDDDGDAMAARHGARANTDPKPEGDEPVKDGNASGADATKSPEFYRMEGVKREREYATQFAAVCDSAKLTGKDREEFEKEFYDLRDIDKVKFFATKIIAARSKAIGEGGGEGAGADLTAEQRAEKKLVDEAAARFNSSREIRTMFGLRSNTPTDSPEYQAALKRYVSGFKRRAEREATTGPSTLAATAS